MEKKMYIRPVTEVDSLEGMRLMEMGDPSDKATPNKVRRDKVF